MIGLVSDDSIQAIVSYLAMYKAAKAPQHTAESLAELENKVAVWVPFCFFLLLLVRVFEHSMFDFPLFFFFFFFSSQVDEGCPMFRGVLGFFIELPQVPHVHTLFSLHQVVRPAGES